jgi:hypothetical protein
MPENQSDSEPHIDRAACVSNIVVYCNVCDESAELALPPQLSRLCDCNQYKRWICLPCSNKELCAWKKYVEQGGVQEKGDHEETFPQRGQEESFTIYHVYGAIIVRTLHLLSCHTNYSYSFGALAGKKFLPLASPAVDGV